MIGGTFGQTGIAPMIPRLLLCGWSAAALWTLPVEPAAGATYKSSPGEHTPQVVDETWHDAQRKREVPVRLYLPTGATGARPVILFSHGLGASREACTYLGKHWCSHGYLCVFVQHRGSDEQLLKGSKRFRLLRLLRSARQPINWRRRPEDVRFALDELARRNESDERLQGRVDLSRCGVSGHSYGAFSALAAVGLLVDLPDADDTSFRDPRLRAAIAMSPIPNLANALDDESASGIAVPCLHMCGTVNDDRAVATRASERRVHFDRTLNADAWLFKLHGAEQFAFTEDEGLDGEVYDRNPVHHDWIRQITTAFWDAELLDDPSAVEWLGGEGFQSVFGEAASLEHKPAPRAETAAE